MSELIGSFLDTLKSFGKSGFQLGKGFIIDESGNVISQSDISGAKVGYPSQTVNTVQDIGTKPSIGSRINPNLALATGGIVGTGAFVAITATNPGFQQTVQSQTGAIQSIADAAKQATQSAGQVTDFLTKNPLILIGGLAILAIALLKK